VLLTMTVRWTFACRHCWATIRATRFSTVVMGGLGAAAGIVVLVVLFIKSGRLMRRAAEVPVAVGFVTSRLFPRFEVEDPPVQTPGPG